MNLPQYKDTLLELVRQGGTVLLKHFGRIKNVRQKERPSSVVCEADFASERHIVQGIRERFPNDGIIAEESGVLPGKSEYTWVIDPLDGTSNFVAGLPWFGVQIGVLKGAEPVLGAMYLPVQGDLYWAAKGEGAFKHSNRLRLRPEKSLKKVLCAFGFDAASGAIRTERNVRLLMATASSVRNTRATNSLLDFCYTLEGSFGACINVNCKIWDIVPVSLIIPEAGGKFTLVTGEKLKYVLGRPGLEVSYEILGANRILHSKLLKALAKAAR